MDNLVTALAGATSPTDETILRALSQDTACGLMLVDAGARVRECNANLACLLGQGSPENVCNRTVTDLLQHAADIHLEALEFALHHNRPAAVDGPIGGRFTRSTYRAIPQRTPGAALATICCRPPESAPPEDVRHLIAPEGPEIASLTRREREILAAIGVGLTTAEIADKLGRSPKTVEGHRVSLGLKLGVNNRVQLARIAIRIGLAPLYDSGSGAGPAHSAASGRGH